MRRRRCWQASPIIPTWTFADRCWRNRQTLPDKILVEVADRERIEHSILAKIAARGQLGDTVTDSLLKRTNAAIQRAILENPNARISEGGFARVIMGLDGDKSLAQMVAARPDLPAELRPWLNEILNS